MTLSTSADVNEDFTPDCGATKLVMDFLSLHHIMNLVRLHSFGPENGLEYICIYEINISRYSIYIYVKVHVCRMNDDEYINKSIYSKCTIAK